MVEVANYYFDMETAPLEHYKDNTGANLDPKTGKIISIQYQKLWQETGEPIGELNILKEWTDGSSEEAIVRQFKATFIDKGEWDFVPIGNNLAFDFTFLKAKFNQYLGEERRRLGHRPLIDVRHILVVMNKGSFKGYDALLGKVHEARQVASWYYSKEHDKIEDYIRREAISFIEKYQILLRELSKIKLDQDSQKEQD